MNHAIKNSRRIKLGYCCWVNDLEDADNIVILEDKSATVLQILSQILCKAMSDVLGTNTSKTNLFKTSQEIWYCIHVNGNNSKQVFHFKYLEITIQTNGQVRDEIKLRVDCAKSTFLSFRKTPGVSKRNKPLQEAAKLPTYLPPIFTNAQEAWPLRVDDVEISIFGASAIGKN